MTNFGATDELLVLGIGAARDGDPVQARFYLEWVLRDEPSEHQAAEAWYWLARVAPDAAERRRCLEQALVLMHLHPEARRDLAILDGRLRATELIDHRQPLAPATPGGPIRSEDVRRPRCPNCGGALVFDASRQMLRCQFCGHCDDGLPGAQAVEEQDWIAAIYTPRGHRWVLPTGQVLACQGCGATQTLPPGHVSTTCTYCGSPQVIVSPPGADLIAPEGIGPFTLTADEVARLARAWLAERPFSPGDLAERAAIQPPRPIYLPCWTFDLEGAIEWRGYADSWYDDDSASGGALGIFNLAFGQHQRPVPVSGTDPLFFDDILVPATQSIPAALLADLRFDTGALVAYSPDTLLGWPAEIYRIPVAEASLAARERVITRQREEILHATHHDVRDLTIQNVTLAVLSYKLILFPVWVSGYRYREQRHQLLINGQTGTVAGTVPRGRAGSFLAELVEPFV